jgi:hypothetical protein
MEDTTTFFIQRAKEQLARKRANILGPGSILSSRVGRKLMPGRSRRRKRI